LKELQKKIARKNKNFNQKLKEKIKMSKIMDIIKNEKVEWKKLGEVCDIIKGKQFNKRDMLEDGKYPVINGGITPSGYVEMYNQSANTITISQGGASAGFINFIENKFWLGAHAFAINPKDTVLNRYIYHFLKLNQEKLQDKKEGAGIPSISKTTLESLEIPIPSLETQEKIVKILDKFTNYVTELQVELQARTKQYSYYRDMLLSEENLNKLSEKIDRLEDYSEIHLFQLEDIIKIKNGKDWKQLGKGKIPVYGSGGEMGIYVDRYSYDKPTVLIPRKGSIENVFYLEELFWNVDTIFHTEIDEEKIVPKYFYYFIENYNIKSLSTDSTRPSLTQEKLNKIKIKLPHIKIQNKVVEILDKFQSLLSDAQGLLPQEIEQRQKQYEFYREKLLTFDEKYDSLPACLPACLIIGSKFFNILKEAAAIVEVELFSKIEWKRLGEICDVKIGEKPKEEIYKTNEVAKYKYINAGTTETGYVYSFNNEKDTVTTPSRGQGGIGFIGFQSEKFWLGALCYGIKSKEEKILINKYLYYYLLNSNQVISLKKEAGIPAINLNELLKIKILLPEFIVQNYVVSILDKFDTLINDLTKGLPKEIELRQKQYEYYREKLLIFSRNN